MKYNPEKSVLNEETDKMLIRNVMQYAEAAGLAGNPQFIWESIKDREYVTPLELKTFGDLDGLVSNEFYGAYWSGATKSPVKKFMAFTGLLTRNYITSVYMGMGELQSLLMKEQYPTARCLFIPDFFVHDVVVNPKKKDIHEWRKDMLYSFLLKRISNGQLTFIYISNFKNMKNALGSDIANFIDENFLSMGIGDGE